jgi:hypothetical protein
MRYWWWGIPEAFPIAVISTVSNIYRIPYLQALLFHSLKRQEAPTV